METHGYILKTIAELKQITTRALKIFLKKDKYVYRDVKTQGGKSSEILFSSLETDIQERYKENYYKEIIKLEAQEEILPPATEKNSENSSKFIPEAAKTIALAKVDLLNDWNDFRNHHKPKQKGDKLFLELYNSGEYLKNVFKVIGKTSRGSLLRWNKVYIVMNCKISAGTILLRLDVTPFNKVYLQEKLLPKNILIYEEAFISVILSPMC